MQYLNHLKVPVTETQYLHYRDTFLRECQLLVDDHMRNYHWEERLIIHKGRRYDKIVVESIGDATEPHNTRVYAFVDKTNGDILKPATWKAPAKHARGNIYEDDRMQFMTAYGPAYMDSIKDYYGA